MRTAELYTVSFKDIERASFNNGRTHEQAKQKPNETKSVVKYTGGENAHTSVLQGALNKRPS